MPTVPAFSQPVFDRLYQSDFFIDEAVLDEIVTLGPAVAVPELLKITSDTLQRFDRDATGTSWYHAFHFLHALYLLHELDASEALDVYLELLRRPHNYQEYWFGDSLYEELPELMARAGRNRLADCMAVVDSAAYTLHSRILMAKALLEIANRYPGERPGILAFFRQHLQRITGHASQIELFFPEDQDPGYGYDIYTYLGFLLSDLQDADARELEEEIRQCHRLDLVDQTIAGDENDLMFRLSPARPYQGVAERYRQFQQWPMGADSPYNPDAAAIQARKARKQPRPATSAPQLSLPKAGRNDPCPCGSGLKYKKCCMA